MEVGQVGFHDPAKVRKCKVRTNGKMEKLDEQERAWC
jgi:hypothetical protein